MPFLFNSAPPTPSIPAGPPPFIPTYEVGPNYIIDPISGKKSLLNPDYFVTESTATELASRFGATHIDSELPQGITPGGPFYLSNPTLRSRYLVWSDGLRIMAGFLASIYTRNPESAFPNLATKMCWDLIASTRAARAAGATT